MRASISSRLIALIFETGRNGTFFEFTKIFFATNGVCPSFARFCFNVSIARFSFCAFVISVILTLASIVRNVFELLSNSGISGYFKLKEVLDKITSIVFRPHIKSSTEEIIQRSELSSSLSVQSFNDTIKDTKLWKNKRGEMILPRIKEESLRLFVPKGRKSTSL